MSGTELDAAIEQANRIFSRQYAVDGGFRRNAVTGPEPKRTNWPPVSLDAERRFGQPHAILFPFIGRKVRTPAGPGTLVQVFADHVTVLLDSEVSKCAVYNPDEIEPASGHLEE